MRTFFNNGVNNGQAQSRRTERGGMEVEGGKVYVCSPTEKRLEQLIRADSWLAGSGVKP